ncbi:protein-disulfide reductase DsbD family protein [Sphingomonas sp. KR1UV-12]|uniref:Protein-disulfide reductase DsbD family protein n=2 Tax=Sphingomonas aurea TaxID=3063994 RepID=A0ABT9EI48_9SPHN|nr:protein-disulfide reductase DsbD domain-containing protein [Sphingomonas sp. KR1UV-12]MDP1026627.1 protein-disulfide reductase DsbD family protein [Sphingomonas sp. KR1UV-12]
MTCLALLLAPAAALAQAPGERHLAMELVAESVTPAPGSTVTLAIAATPQPGWHGYWQNPGDAGFPMRADWTLPAGAKVGTLRYPVPERLIVAGLMNYVYERPYALLVDLAVPAGLAEGTRLPVGVTLDYLVCTRQVCVPEKQTVSLALTVGRGAIVPAVRARFDGWRRALPRPLGSVGTWQAEAGALRMSVPFPADAAPADAYFYPAEAGTIDMAAHQTVTREGDRLVVATKAAATPPTGRIEGVLATGDGQGFAVSAMPGSVARPSAGGSGWGVALVAFAGAVLGGLILNVMPCVFPILSLKALSLAKSGGTEGAARAEALAYTAGVVLVCLALGAGLLALRAGGATVGWAFQLQDPRVIGVLLLLVTGIAFNLAGLFELPTPRFAGRAGTGGAFATGALAAFVATPCTGPFMGAALGAALVLPAAAALLVFAGLGLGIALPFLALGFVPALRRRLPKPGAWMARLRRILSLPMFLTALALAWVLGRQAGVDGMTLGLAALLIAATGLWWTGRRQLAGRERSFWPAGVAGALAFAAVLTLQPAPAGAAKVAGGEAFTEARLTALRAEGRPVFAYFTADWCLTCKVNEKAAIERDGVQASFAKAKVAVLVGDWTDGDPAMGRFIERHNRAGVPLYLYYAPGAAAPRVLPQVLTPAMLEALGT